MRAFLNRHIDMLQDPSRWPVPHFVQQLAAQEPDSTFGRASCVVKASATIMPPSCPTIMPRIIEWVIKPRVQHPLRLALNSRDAVRALAFLPEGARLAQLAQSNNAVVADSMTGFMLSTLRVDGLIFLAWIFRHAEQFAQQEISKAYFQPQLAIWRLGDSI